jgi:hypothetical protein
VHLPPQKHRHTICKTIPNSPRANVMELLKHTFLLSMERLPCISKITDHFFGLRLYSLDMNSALTFLTSDKSEILAG